MAKIGILCAMEKERRLIGSLSGGTYNEICCRISGIGKVNAAVAACDLIREFRPDMILSIGAAGTFSRNLKEGDIVIAERTAFHDIWCGEGNIIGQADGCPVYFEGDTMLLERASHALPEASRGLVISGDQFFISDEEDRRQKALYPDALAVDMESAAVAQVCFLKKVPFLAVRIISDTHLDGRQAEHYGEFWDGIAGKSFEAVRKLIGEL